MAKGPTGTVHAKHRFEQAMDRQSGGSLSWSQVGPELIWTVLHVLTDDGDAVTFGKTSDGGALMMGVLSGGRVMKAYFDSAEAAETRLQALRDAP